MAARPSLPKRLSRATTPLEREIQAIDIETQNYLRALRAELDELQSRIEEIQADIETIEGDIAAIEADPRWTDDRIAYALRSATTVVDVSAATAPTAGQVLTAVDDSTAEWQDPSGGGGSSLDVWLADALDTGAPFYDATTSDEFSGASIDAKWTENDPGSAITFAADSDRGMIKATVGGVAAFRWGFLYQPVPGSEFTAYCKVSCIHNSVRILAGLFVSQNMATLPTTADTQVLWTGFYDGAATTSAGSLTDYTGNNGIGGAFNIATYSPGVNQFCPYLRIRCNGTSFIGDVSPDGISWTQGGAGQTLGYTPASFGIAVYNENASSIGTVLFDFFRVYAGAGASVSDATRIGGLV